MEHTWRTRQVIERLRAGNARHVRSAEPARDLLAPPDAKPIAAILACSDIKATPEQLFDLSPGEFYVMQTPATIISDAEAAGVMLANLTDGLELVVVLGHHPCRTMRHSMAKDCEDSGGLFRDIHMSRTLLGFASGGWDGGALASVHTSRMALALRRKLSQSKTRIRVVAGVLNEATGSVALE